MYIESLFETSILLGLNVKVMSAILSESMQEVVSFKNVMQF